MPSPTSISDLAELLGLSESEVRSTIFHVVDFLIETADNQDVIDVGIYEVPGQLVSDKSMLAAGRAMMWATYEVAIGEKPEAAGLWVTLDQDGLHVSNTRTGL